MFKKEVTGHLKHEGTFHRGHRLHSVIPLWQWQGMWHDKHHVQVDAKPVT